MILTCKNNLGRKMKNPSPLLHDWYYFLCIVEFLRWAVALINFRSRKHFRCFQNKRDSFCGRETERETYTVKRKMEAELKDMIDDLESLKRSLPDSSLHASINKVISIYQFGSTIFLLFYFLQCNSQLWAEFDSRSIFIHQLIIPFIFGSYILLSIAMYLALCKIRNWVF